MSLAYFVAAMRCPVCGTVSPADSTTSMANHLGPEAETILRVGDEPDITVGAMRTHLLTASEPEGDEAHILQTWHCPTCGSLNWAEVVFVDGQIASIDNVPLTRSVLSRANFIHDDLGFMYEDLTGESLYRDNKVRADFVPTLLARLPP